MHLERSYHERTFSFTAGVAYNCVDILRIKAVNMINVKTAFCSSFSMGVADTLPKVKTKVITREQTFYLLLSLRFRTKDESHHMKGVATWQASTKNLSYKLVMYLY
jgi:hypothetical protein